MTGVERWCSIFTRPEKTLNLFTELDKQKCLNINLCTQYWKTSFLSVIDTGLPMVFVKNLKSAGSFALCRVCIDPEC